MKRLFMVRSVLSAGFTAGACVLLLAGGCQAAKPRRITLQVEDMTKVLGIT